MGYKHGYATIIVNVCDFATIRETPISGILWANFLLLSIISILEQRIGRQRGWMPICKLAKMDKDGKQTCKEDLIHF